MSNTPRKSYHMASHIPHTETGMSMARSFYYVPELENMIISGHRMAKEENTSTFQREIVTFLTGFLGRMSITYGQNKASKIVFWIETIIRKDELGVWRLKRDGFRDLILPFSSLPNTDCLAVLDISRYVNFFNYIKKLVSKYDSVRSSEWNELVKRLDTLARPMPLRTATVQASFPNISHYGAIYGYHRFDYEYQMCTDKDERDGLANEIRSCLSDEIQQLITEFIVVVAFNKSDRNCARKFLKLFGGLNAKYDHLSLNDAEVRARVSIVVEKFAELHHPSKLAPWRRVIGQMDLLDAGLLVSAADGNYLPLPRGVADKTPVSFSRGVIQKDILQSLHGIGRDEAGKEKYSNGIFIKNILILAQGGVDCDGRPNKAMVLTESMPWTDTTRVCCGCARVFYRDKNMKKCGRCKISHYCSTKCQKSHWNSGHREFCMFPEAKHAEMRPMYKGIRAIERLVMELGECKKSPSVNMFFKSWLNTFCTENEIRADTFMVLPGAHMPQTTDLGSNNLSVVFFKSEDIIRHLNYESNALCFQMRHGNDSQDGGPDRKTCEQTVRGIRGQVDLLRSKKKGEAFVMGSFDSHALVISKIDTKAWERV